jgi:HPt (histidine-containing phosphotransfer) domain-containing protein
MSRTPQSEALHQAADLTAADRAPVATLAEPMGGEIGVTSAPSSGSRCWFAVRVQRPAAAVGAGLDNPGRLGQPGAMPQQPDPPEPGPTPPLDAPDAVTLDPAALRPIRELEGLGRPGLFDEMLGLFRDEGTVRLAHLRDAVARRDPELVYRLAHTMKGEALAWGAAELVEAARELEGRARSGRLDALGPAVHELERLFEATLAALAELRATPT